MPHDWFVNPAGETQLRNEQSEFWELERIDWAGGGIRLYLKNAMFPYKGFINVEILWAVNIVKSFFIESVKVFSIKPILFGFFLSGFSIKNIERMIEAFNRHSWKVISPYILKDMYLKTMTRELQFCIFTFLYELGIREEVCDRFASIFVHLIEYDNAYWHRVQDIFYELSVRDLKRNPRKEIKRLMNLVKERDSETLIGKVGKLVNIFTLILYIPKVKRAFLKMADQMRIALLKPDTGDIYWLCMRTDYKFLGMTFEERQEYGKKQGWTFPPKMDTNTKV